MTAQINDTCFHRKTKFAIAADSGSGLFDPRDVGIDPLPLNTACMRGYIAHYTILDDQLFLTNFNVGIATNIFGFRAKDPKMPEVFDVTPTFTGFFGFAYEGLQAAMPFTGSLFLGENFVYRVHLFSGQHPAMAFAHVREIIFKAGRVLDDHDRSSEMAALRAKVEEEMEHVTFEVIDSTGHHVPPRAGDNP